MITPGRVNGALDQGGRRILLFDSLAGLSAGTLVLTFHEFLTTLYGVPSAGVLVIGATNLLYACYSGSLARQAYAGAGPGSRAINVLIAGNLLWAGICAILVAAWWSSASAIGLVMIAVEGVFVGALALVEYRFLCGRPGESGA